MRRSFKVWFGGLGLACGFATAGLAAEEPIDFDALMSEAASGLAAAKPGYVLVLGDSNAAAIKPGDLSCGGDLVNLGVGGVGSSRYRELLGKVRIPDGGKLAIVNVGIGDLVRKRDPGSDAAMAAFDAAIAGIIETVKPHVGTVVVNALPPLGGRFALKLDAGLVQTYSMRAKTVCERLGCTYVDAWAPIRDGDFGTVWPSASPDGIHVKEAGAMVASAVSGLCAPRVGGGGGTR